MFWGPQRLQPRDRKPTPSSRDVLYVLLFHQVARKASLALSRKPRLRVFLAHRRNQLRREQQDDLEKDRGLVVSALEADEHAGSTLATSSRHYSKSCDAAVVVATADVE